MGDGNSTSPSISLPQEGAKSADENLGVVDSINETLKSENEEIVAQNRNFHIKKKEDGIGANGS